MLNNITLMGRLTADPDYRTTQSGVALARFSLAVERDYSGSDGERATDFIDIVAWRTTADFVSRYFRKGQLVAVIGSLQSENYTDQSGNKRRSWSVQAQHCYFAEPKRDTQTQPQNPPCGYNSPDAAYPPGYQQAAYGGYASPRDGYNGQQPQPQPPYQGQQVQMNGYQPAPSYPYQTGYQSGGNEDLPF